LVILIVDVRVASVFSVLKWYVQSAY
jgi:hypothetical protein